MNSLRQIRGFFLTMSLAVMLAITVAFSFGSTGSCAATSLTQLIRQPQTQIAMNRSEAIAKNLEGKAQEASGNVTGDPKDRMMGKAKQAESQVRNAAEDLKEKTKAVTKNIKGKVKEVRGK